MRQIFDHRSTLQAVADLVRDRYVFADVADRVASRLYERLAAGAYDDLDCLAFAVRLTEDLRAVSGDLHLRVRYSSEPHVPEIPGETVREQNDRAQHCREIGYGIASVHNSEGDVAILDIRELVEPELSRAAFEAALASIASAPALVIDLRKCVGGDPNTVALLCSHIFDDRIQLSSILPRAGPAEHFWADPSPYKVRFGGVKRLFVTVAHFTFSGAEMLAYDLQASGRAVVIGEVTGGGANPCAFHWPSPNFSLLLPEARAVNPITSSNWEGCGVSPDLICSESVALDRALEQARLRIAAASPVYLR